MNVSFNCILLFCLYFVLMSGCNDQTPCYDPVVLFRMQSNGCTLEVWRQGALVDWAVSLITHTVDVVSKGRQCGTRACPSLALVHITPLTTSRKSHSSRRETLGSRLSSCLWLTMAGTKYSELVGDVVTHRTEYSLKHNTLPYLY